MEYRSGTRQVEFRQGALLQNCWGGRSISNDQACSARRKDGSNKTKDRKKDLHEHRLNSCCLGSILEDRSDFLQRNWVRWMTNSTKGEAHKEIRT